MAGHHLGLRALLAAAICGGSLAWGQTVLTPEADSPSPFAPVDAQSPPEEEGFEDVESTVPERITPRRPSPVNRAREGRSSELGQRPSRGGLSVSRTRERRDTIDPAGLHRTVSTLVGTEILLEGGESVGYVRDLVIGPNGAVEFLVGSDGDWSYVLPYDVTRFDDAGETLTLSLSQEQFAAAPAFHGTVSSLDFTDYRRRLHLAYRQAESEWGLPTASLEPSVERAAPIPRTAASASRVTNGQPNDTVSAPGLPILAQPQAPVTTGRGAVVIAAPTPVMQSETQGGPQPTATTPLFFAPGVPRQVNRAAAGRVPSATQGLGTAAGSATPNNPSSLFPQSTPPNRQTIGGVDGFGRSVVAPTQPGVSPQSVNVVPQPPNTGPRPPTTGPQPPNTGPQPPISGPQSTITGPQSPITGPQPP